MHIYIYYYINIWIFFIVDWTLLSSIIDEMYIIYNQISKLVLDILFLICVGS